MESSFFRDAAANILLDPYVAISHMRDVKWTGSRARAFERQRNPGQDEPFPKGTDPFRAFIPKRVGVIRHLLHVGVMMNHALLKGELSPEDDAWPAPREVSDLFGIHPGVINVLHYIDRDGRSTLDDVDEAIGYGGLHLHALQLVKTGLHPDFLIGLRTRHGTLRLILEIGEREFAEAGDRPETVLEQLRRYQGVLNDVVLDLRKEGGRTRDVKAIRELIVLLRRDLPDLGVCVAGGLGPHLFTLIASLLREFPTLSIEGKEQCFTKASMVSYERAQKVDAFLDAAVRALRNVGEGAPRI